jgi:protein-tyrosine-phosphatase
MGEETIEQGKIMNRVLFICARNRARSQMAEGPVNHDLAGEIQAFSLSRTKEFFWDPQKKDPQEIS